MLGRSIEKSPSARPYRWNRTSRARQHPRNSLRPSPAKRPGSSWPRARSTPFSHPTNSSGSRWPCPRRTRGNVSIPAWYKTSPVACASRPCARRRQIRIHARWHPPRHTSGKRPRPRASLLPRCPDKSPGSLDLGIDAARRLVEFPRRNSVSVSMRKSTHLRKFASRKSPSFKSCLRIEAGLGLECRHRGIVEARPGVLPAVKVRHPIRNVHVDAVDARRGDLAHALHVDLAPFFCVRTDPDVLVARTYPERRCPPSNTAGSPVILRCSQSG